MPLLDLLLRPARLPIVCALLLPSLLLIIAAIQAERSEQRLVLSYQWVSHTHEVEARLQDVNLYATRLAAGTKRLADRESLRQAARAVQELTRDNAVQQEAMVPLNAKVQALIASPGGAGLDELSEHCASMWSEEERLLGMRQESLLHRIRLRTIYLRALVVANAVLLGGMLLAVRRLTRLERFVHICAWTRTISYEGEWLTFEQYLERRFKIKTSHGIAPEEAERLLAELKDFPDSESMGKSA